MKPEIQISNIRRDAGTICGDVTCNNQNAYFRWDKATDELRLFQKTKFLKKEVAPSEIFFTYKEALTDAIAREVDSFLTAEAKARINPLDQLIAEAEEGRPSPTPKKQSQPFYSK